MKPFIKGLRDGLPIGAGYFAVAFSLGIIAKNAGLSAPMGFISSFLTRASAGEYGAYTLIAAGATFIELFAVCVIANLRYLLMGAALTQKFDSGMPLWKRIVTACCITDEIFGISIAYPGKLPMSYPVGATLSAATLWACGTACGIIAGNILPVNIVEALSVALYGMFIAIIVPPGKHDRAVGIAVLASFAISWLCSVLPGISGIGSGVKIFILTVLVASAAAIIKPIPDDDDR